MEIKLNRSNKDVFTFNAVKATKDHKHFETWIVDVKINFAIDPSKTFDGRLFIRKLSASLFKLKNKNFYFNLDSFLDLIPKKQITNMCFAIVCKLNSLNLTDFCLKTNKEKKTQFNIIVSKKYEQVYKLANEVGLATNYAQYAQVAPCNHMGIKKFIDFVKQKLAGVKKVKVSLLAQSELNKMQLLQAVNKGSDETAQVLILEYYNNAAKKKVALVGKGIMMDTGGYSLKPSHAMKKMNEDMTNAAAVFGTILALAKNKTKVNAVGVIPLAKNFINDKAYKVGDIYTAYNGKTVEVNDTDAEGRLILADAISYTDKKIAPTVLLSCATLTGLSALCFGEILNPFWSTNPKIAKQFYNACSLAGEYALELPLLPEYLECVEKSSTVADYGNLNFGKTAGNATAAAFLSKFNSKNDNFIHLDNAGTNEYCGKSINPFVLIFYNFVLNIFNRE